MALYSEHLLQKRATCLKVRQAKNSGLSPCPMYGMEESQQPSVAASSAGLIQQHCSLVCADHLQKAAS